VKELEDPRAALRGVVDVDVQLRHAAQADPSAELAPDERHGPAQRGEGGPPLGRLADQADPDSGVGEIRRDVDLGDRHEADAGVGDLAAEQAADLLAQELANPVSALAHADLRVGDIVGVPPPWPPGIVSRARTD
jgi:hypothetical protein